MTYAGSNEHYALMAGDPRYNWTLRDDEIEQEREEMAETSTPPAAIHMTRLRLHGSELRVQFRFNQSLVDAIRNLDSRRRWDAMEREWVFPAEPEIVRAVVGLLGVGDSELEPKLRSLLEAGKPTGPQPEKNLAAEIGRWWPQGFSHQHAGVALLVERASFLLAWEMGTGKTAVAARRLLFARERGELEGRTLVLCPKSVARVWPEELRKHAGLSSVTLEGTAKQRQSTLASLSSDAILVCNYELAAKHLDDFLELGFQAIICDEAHRIKNVTAITSKAVARLGKHAAYRWALTGTPAPNSPLDIFGICRFLDQALLGWSYVEFRAKYAILGQHKQAVGYRNLNELENLVATVSSRVRKEQCLDLPEKTFVERRCELSPAQRRCYESLRSELVAELESSKGKGTLSVRDAFAATNRLLQVVGGFLPDDTGLVHSLESAKLKLLDEVIEDFGQEQIIVWASFRAEVDAIADRFKGEVALYHGGMSADDRQRSVDAFKSGGKRFFVATPQSGREGLTLVNCASVVYYSRGWNLLDFVQSADRVHRIGQTRPVTIVSLIADDTVDGKVSAALGRKTSLQELVMRGSITDWL